MPPIQIGGHGGRGAKTNGGKLNQVAVVAGRVMREQMSDHAQRLVADLPAHPLVDAERLELGLHPADSDPEDQTAAGKFLDSRDLFGGEHGGTIGQNEYRDAQADSLGHAGEVGQRGQHVEITAARALGVVRRDAQMVRDENRVETQRLGGLHAGANRRAGRLRSHVAHRDSVFH